MCGVRWAAGMEEVELKLKLNFAAQPQPWEVSSPPLSLNSDAFLDAVQGPL